MNRKMIIAIVLSVVMVASGLVVLFSGYGSTGNSASHATSSVTVTPSSTSAVKQNTGPSVSAPAMAQRAAMMQRILSNAKSSGIPMKYVYIPNFMSSSKIVDGHVTPGYSAAPAPMGIGDYGLYNSSGVIKTYNYTTDSFEASVNLSYLNDFYLLDNDPNSVSFQLNAVLNNVALFGNSSYSMWTQNVVFYSPRTQTLEFIDNVWNFSSPAAYLTPNAINYSSAQAVGLGSSSQGYHYGLGPILTVTFPLVFNVYLNTSVQNGRSTVYFNYSLPTMHMHGNYDEVIFNSTYGAPGYVAPHPHYFVSGTTITPTGFIPYDAEIMIGGPGGGSTATVYGINGTMNLRFWNATTSSYQNVRAAYDLGSETGETSVGVDVSYVGQTAYLNPGPSIIYGLWNVTPSFTKYAVTVKPANSFLFINNNMTMENESIWAWAPSSGSGSNNFRLPTGTYQFESMLNYYEPAMGTLNTSIPTVINMVSDSSAGVYTPIVAMSNSQLASVAVSGTGTASDPYVIMDNGTANSVFGSVNDYTFPAFGGVLLRNITDHVVVKGTGLAVQYTGINAEIESIIAQVYLNDPYIPMTNGLTMQLYNDSNITIADGNGIEAWFSPEITQFFYVGALNIWNSTNISVTGNTFISWGTSIMMYNSPTQRGMNTITGNYFVGISVMTQNTSITAPAFLAGIGDSQYQYAIQIYSGNNTIYNNAFFTQVPVLQDGYNLYEGTFTTNYTNHWNVSPMAGTNIMGGSGISGNYWWNDFGKSFYNSGISQGGDMSPIQPAVPANLTFTSANYMSGDEIAMQYMGLVMITTTTSKIAYIDMPNQGFEELYIAEEANANGHLIGVQSGLLNTSAGGNFEVPLFAQYSVYAVTFTETGLASGTTWSVSFDGTTMTGTGSSITFSNVTAGTHDYSIASVSGYTFGSPSSGSVDVTGSRTVSVTFVAEETVTFTETGLASGTTWSISFDGTTASSTTSTITFTDIPQGTYTYQVSPVSGYNLISTGGTLSVSGQPATETITFTPVPTFSVTFVEVGLANNTKWAVNFDGTNYTATTTNSHSSSITVSGLSAGTYAYYIYNVSGYTHSASAGVISIDGPTSIAVTFNTVPSTISSGTLYEFLAIGLVVGLIVGGLAVFFLRKTRPPEAPPATPKE